MTIQPRQDMGMLTETRRSESEDGRHGTNNGRSGIVFDGNVRVCDYAFRARTGFTARFGLPGVLAVEPHPFAGSATGFAFGRRLLLRLCDANGTSLFDGEAILLWWGDDSRRGKRADFALDADHGGIHPLSGCVAGNRDGDVLMATFEDAHDTTPVPPGERALRRRLLALAHELPKDPKFRAWFLTHVDGDVGPDEEDMACALRRYCGLGSRRELLADGAFAEQARGRLRGLIADWRASGDGLE
jgi:hypothetical protein